MKTLTLVIILALLPLFGACDKSEPAPEATESEPAKSTTAEPAEKPATEGEEEEKEEEEEAEEVEVASDGTKFDPPVEPERLPPGAWFCDMGTVHYAQIEEGEKCPVCGMKLKQYKPADYEDHHDDDHHDDDHHDGDHHDDDHHDHEDGDEHGHEH